MRLSVLEIMMRVFFVRNLTNYFSSRIGRKILSIFILISIVSIVVISVLSIIQLRVVFSQKGLEKSKNIEELFANVRNLQSKKVVPKGWLEARNINLNLGVANTDDYSEICAINH